MLANLITQRKPGTRVTAQSVSTREQARSGGESKERRPACGLEVAWDEWQRTLHYLRAVEEDGWTNPAYAKTLFDEQRAYRRLLAVQRGTRARSLPV